MSTATATRTAIIRGIPETGRKYRFAGRGPDGHGLPWPARDVTVKIVAAPKNEAEFKAWKDPVKGTSFWVVKDKEIRPRYEEPTEVTEEQLAEIMADPRIAVRVLDGQGGDAADVIEAKSVAAKLEKDLQAARAELSQAAEERQRYQQIAEENARRAGDAIAQLESKLATLQSARKK